MVREKRWLIAIAALGTVVWLAAAAIYFRHQPRSGSRPPTDQTSLVASMIVLLGSQATFHKTDYYGIGRLVYANTRDGRGLYDLYEIRRSDGSTRKVNLIDRALAEAIRTGEATGGYRIIELTGDENGPFDPAIEFGICCVPSPYSPGMKTHFLGVGDSWGRDTGGKLPPGYTAASTP